MMGEKIMLGWTVTDIDSNEELRGAPSASLVRASVDAGDTGAVLAYADEDGDWHHVRADRADDYRRIGHDVRTVYVTEA